jgi:predicted DNA-binding transcriptional regulator YafY
MSEKAETIFKLALQMHGTSEGMSLDDIRHEFKVSRRTAERMRDTVERILPQMEGASSEGRVKRWRLPAGTMNRLISFQVDEVLALENAIKSSERDGDTVQIENLRTLLTKVHALQPDRVKLATEPDLEALLEAEGYALRPGPRPIIDPEVLHTIRHAIKAGSKIRIRYQSRETGKTTNQKVCPYGLIHGNRNYLVAFSLNPNVLDYRLYSLSNIKRIEVLEESFIRDEAFTLDGYMHNSFGVFQEEPIDVVWKFSPNAAPDAKEWIFHPSQTMEELDDGSLIVRFRAGGRREMDWHLYTWGDEVEDLTHFDGGTSKRGTPHGV